MKNKTMKKAMITSIIALVLCFAMLVGTTYAWFTDSVTSANNIIKSGTLNIDLLVKRGNDYVSVRTNDDPIFNYDKWEPGYVAVAWAKVATKGNLALKYTMKIIANGQVSDLADVIDVYYINGDVQPTRAQIAAATPLCTLRQALEGGAQFTINDTLIPDAQADAAGYTKYSDPVTIALKMRESAGNEYQDLDIGGTFSFQILATQYTYEADSFDNQYDAAAEYPVSDQAGFAAALTAAAGQPVTVVLSAGNYEIPASTDPIDGLTIKGAPGTTIDTVNVSGTNVGKLTNFTAEGVTFVSSTDNSWDGIISHKTTLENATFKDCVITSEGDNDRTNGIYGPTFKDVTFEGCTIYGDVYGLNDSYLDGTMTLKDCDITGWNSFGAAKTAGGTSKVVIDNCHFHRSSEGYNKLRFYQDAEVTNSKFDTAFFANTNDTYGTFAGGIDAAANDINITLTGNKVVDTTNGNQETALAVGNLANYNGVTGVVWTLDGTVVNP